MLILPAELARAIRQHAQRAYPEECCGALLGVEEGEARRVVDVLALENERGDGRRNRFLVGASGVVHAEREAARRRLLLLGWYHSHPDAPARPSNYDREHAWPWYSYLIVAVDRGHAGEITCWRLAADRATFACEPVQETVSAPH